MTQPLILITNDDGIDSPGLEAVVGALDGLGELLIVAPRVQQTSMGRSRSQKGGADGRLFEREISYGGKSWPAFAANATPALAVEHAVKELAQRQVDLVVSGINFGENVGSCVTVSGTIGAALEAADLGIPAIAASIEIDHNEYDRYDDSVDFSAAAWFVRFFAEGMLGRTLPGDVDLLKIEVPVGATVETAWMVTRQDKLAYYQPTARGREDLFSGPGRFDHEPQKGRYTGDDTDAYALAQGLVSVTPMSLDMTARIGLDEMDRWMKRS